MDKPSGRLDMPAIRRRVEFVLNEARCGMKVRDKTLTFALRVISNYCLFEKDLNSRDIKFKTKLMSQAALDRKRDNPENWWRQGSYIGRELETFRNERKITAEGIHQIEQDKRARASWFLREIFPSVKFV